MDGTDGIKKLDFLSIMNDNLREFEIEETEAINTLVHHPEENKEMYLSEDTELLNSDALSRIFESRLKALNLPFQVTNKFLLVCRFLFVDRPGIAITLLRILYEFNKKHPAVSTFTVTVLSETLFPNGVPTEEGFRKMWESQKYTPELGTINDNLLDLKEYWE